MDILTDLSQQAVSSCQIHPLHIINCQGAPNRLHRSTNHDYSEYDRELTRADVQANKDLCTHNRHSVSWNARDIVHVS